MKQKLLFQPQQIEIGSFSDRDEEPNYRERDSVPIDDCNRDYYATVSYTHLTLPTICSV